MMASATESTLGEAVLERLCQAAQPARAAPTRTESWWWPLLQSQAGPGTPQGTNPAQCRKMSRLRASISSTAVKPSMAKRPLIRSA
jgi:hypothetical protein